MWRTIKLSVKEMSSGFKKFDLILTIFAIVAIIVIAVLGVKGAPQQVR